MGKVLVPFIEVREEPRVFLLGDLQLISGPNLVPSQPEATLTSREIVQGLTIGHGIELRPEQIGEVELGVGGLPEDEVAEALLPPGADEEVRVRLIREGKPFRQDGLVDGRRAQASGLHVRDETPDGLGDVPAPSVIGGNLKAEPGVVGGEVLRVGDSALELFREGGTLADNPQTNIVLLESPHLAAQCAEKEGP